MHIVLGVIAFTLFVVCVIFWGGAIATVLVLLVRAAIFLTLIAIKIGVVLFGAMAWVVLFPFNPRMAMAALRGDHYHPKIRPDPSMEPEGLPYPVKIYRAKRA